MLVVKGDDADFSDHGSPDTDGWGAISPGGCGG
jgi:hypothetical protein